MLPDLNCRTVWDMRQNASDSVLKMAKVDKKKEALQLLSKNISQSRVAQLVKVDRRTITRWLKDDDFWKQLNENRRDHLESALDKVLEDSSIASDLSENNQKISQIDSLLAKALAALDSIISCPESRNVDRLKASEMILKLVGDRVQVFAGNTGGISSGSLGASAEGGDRSVEVDRLWERRQQLKNRITVLKKQQG